MKGGVYMERKELDVGPAIQRYEFNGKQNHRVLVVHPEGRFLHYTNPVNVDVNPLNGDVDVVWGQRPFRESFVDSKFVEVNSQVLLDRREVGLS
jgi:hypothetical protein